MFCRRLTRMLTSPSVYKVETQIALIYIYSPIYYITMCCKNQYRGMTLNTTFQNCHFKFSNRHSSVDIASKVPKSLGYVLCRPLEGKMSENLYLGSGYFCM